MFCQHSPQPLVAPHPYRQPLAPFLLRLLPLLAGACLVLVVALVVFYIVLSAPAAPSLSIPVVVVAACTVLVVSGALRVPCLGINCDVEAQEAQEA